MIIHKKLSIVNNDNLVMDKNERALILSKLQQLLYEKSPNGKMQMSIIKRAEAYLSKFESSKRWINKIKSPRTKARYVKSFFRYCIDLNINPDQILKLKPTQSEIAVKIAYAIQQGLKPEEIKINERLAEDTLEDYLEKATFKLGGKLRIKHAVISFYKKNGRPLSSDVAEKWVQREKEPSEYKIPTVEDVENMANNTDNIRDEAIIWFLESTGFRRSTVPLLKWKDLQEVRHVNGEIKLCSIFEKQKQGELDVLAPIFIGIGSERLKGKYQHVQQLTFLHFKAYKVLMEYKKFLERELKVKIEPTTPVFLTLRKPFRAVDGIVVYEAVVESSVSAFGNGKIFKPHDLRRFNQTMLEKARVPENWVKRIQGKKLARQQKPYSLPQIKELHEAYKSAVIYLVPKSEPIPQEHLIKQVSKLTENIEQQTDKYETLKAELKRQQTIIEKQQETLEQFQKAFRQYLIEQGKIKPQN